MVNLTRIFYNPDLSWHTNAVMWWAWESIVHHIYFIVLWVNRQFSETWKTGELWRLNMEKECKFFADLFGGDARRCADCTMTLFSGIWFDTATPHPEQKNWVGRMVTNFQHTEAIFHWTIVLSGFLMVLLLSGATEKDRVVKGCPSIVRWIFFIALFFETYTMCWPYLFLFGWSWVAVIPPKDPIVDTLISFSDENSYMDGIQLGAQLITMFWVSVVVLLLDGWAMWRAGQFAMGPNSFLPHFSLHGICTAGFFYYANEFFKPGARGTGGKETLATKSLDWLHNLYGDGPKVSMLEVAKLTMNKK